MFILGKSEYFSIQNCNMKPSNQFEALIKNVNLFVFLLAFLLHRISGLQLFSDGDPAWHIYAGYAIRDAMSIPTYDPWSSVSHTQTWYNISWLWDLLLSYAHTYIGDIGLGLSASCLFAGLITLVHKTLVGTCKNMRYDSLTLVVALIALSLLEIPSVRPHITTLFMLLFTQILINGQYDSYKKQRAKNTESLKRMVASIKVATQLFCLVAIWANLHGGFTIIYTVLGAIICEGIYEKDPSLVAQFSLLLLISFIASLCNPSGYKIYLGIGRTLDSVMFSYIGEWHPFCFGLRVGASITVAVLLLCALAYKRHYKTLHIQKYEWLLSTVWLIASLVSIRNFAVWLVLCAKSLVAALDAAIPYAKYPIKPSAPWLKALNIVAFISVICVCPYLPDRAIMLAQDEINFVIANYPNHKIFNDYNIGGNIIYLGHGKMKHFIDGRAGTAFSEEVLSDYLSYYSDREGWQNIFEKYQFNAAIIKKEDLKKTSVDVFFKRWQMVYSGNYGNVYIHPSISKPFPAKALSR